jgi:uncharacterized protein YqeY
MALTDQINEDIKAAMKAKEREKLEALRAIKSALLLAATEKGGGTSTEDAEIQMLSKLVKQRKESADIYHQQGRKDLAEVEEKQAELIQSYLPEQADESEIQEVVNNAIEQLGASGMKDMGKVMGVVNGKLAGKAEGKVIADIVKKALQ